MSLKKFIKEYTLPHELGGAATGNARMIRKRKNEPCPFYDSRLPGCSIQAVKPQVCTAAFYLSKMNLVLCEKNQEMTSFPNCLADNDLRERISKFRADIKTDQDAERFFRDLVQTQRTGDFIRLLLRLKGLEIYFGKETAIPFIKKLGLMRLPSDDEMRFLAFIFSAILL